MQGDRVGVATALSPATVGHFKFLFHLLFVGLGLVVRGLLNKQIAFEIGTVEKTVKVHRARVMEKMKVQSLPDLVRIAHRLGVGSA